MANEGDRIEVQFTETEALAQKLLDQLERDVAQAQAIGDELEVARLQAKKQAIAGGQYTPRQTPEIEQDTAALERENVVRQRGLTIELQTLEVLRQQVAERIALEEATTGQRVGAAPQILPAVGTRLGGGFEQLAGQQVAMEEAAALERARQEEERITQQVRQQAMLREDSLSRLQQIGQRAGAAGGVVPAGPRQQLIEGPQGAGASMIGGAYTADEQALARYNIALGEYQGLSSRASETTGALTADVTRLGMVESEASNAMRRHGALTTEWIQALARGETTVSELGYQLGATVGKVAGWTAATGVTFAGLGALVEFGKGAIDSANGVQQLQRTVDSLNTAKAAMQFRQLSQETDVSIHQASDAVFQFSRTFHNQDDAVAAARLGLSAYQLDNVQLSDSVKMSTALHQQYGLNLRQLGGVYDLLSSAQREYNARISDMIPLLQKSSGAVRNAGGDLTQLIQLGAAATRITQLSGAQVGTGFYRAASRFTRQNAGQLASQFGLGRDINPMTGQMNFTQLLMDAIKESVNLSGPQRTQLATDIFGPQYGGRFGALFTQQSAALLTQMTGGGREALTPQATRGATQRELDVQLQQTRKELDQFVFGIQRLGAALAETGALAPLGATLRVAIAGLDELTHLIDIFNQLPGPVKDVVSLLVELRLAMLFFSRTRFGSSTPGITRIPGFRPSEATLARGELATGTRAALSQIENDIGRTTAQMLTTGAQAVTLEQRRKQLIAQAGGEEALTVDQLERANAMSTRIVALKAQQATLEGEQAAQEAARAELNAQMVGITATSRRTRFTDDQVLALRNRTAAGTSAAGADVGGAAEANRAVEDAALYETMGLSGASRAAMGAEGAVSGLGARALGFVKALDPLTVGLIAFPFIYQSISDAVNAASKATQQATDAANAPVNSAQDLFQHAQRLQRAADKQAQSHIGGIAAPFQGLTALAGGILNDPSLMAVAGNPAGAAQSRGLAEQLHAIGDLYTAAERLFRSDGKEMITTQAGRQRLYQVSQELKQRVGGVLQGSGLSPGEIGKIYEAFTRSLQNDYNAIATDPKAGGSRDQIFQLYAQLPAKTIQQHLQSLDDISKIFGTNNDSLRTAALGYAALINRARNWTDPQSLQAVASAQQNFINAVNKNVQDLLHQATLGTTDQSQMGSLDAAVRLLQTEREQVESSFAAAISYAKRTHEGAAAIKKLQDSERQMLAQLGDLHKQVIQAALELIKSESDVVTSEIQGISPEADLARQASTVQGLVRQLNFARGHGADAQEVNQLVSQLNDAQTSLLKQRIDNARSILDAQGGLSVASVTGISPQDDITRAQREVSRAQDLLAFDQSHGMGESQILQDQASLDEAVRNLNQQLQQRSMQLAQDLAAYIQAQSAFAQTQTVNPVTQAREALAADVKALATIQPQDYRTYQEYQTALLNQKAKVGQDQRNVRQQIVDQDMATLQFELHTQRITDQQYVDGLQQLLKMKKLTLAERQQIQSEIFDTLHQTAIDLNVGNIRMPTSYEVRAAIRGAMRRGMPAEGVTHTMVNAPVTNHLTMNVYVNSGKDPHIRAVADAVVRGLNQVNGQAQAVGAI